MKNVPADEAQRDSAGSVDCDVVVFGSGAGGMTAALVAACEGLRVVLCEKSPQLGGTTATSGGAVWIPGTRQASAAGAQDSLDDARRFLQHELGAVIRPELVDAYLASGPEALEYLERNTAVRFDYMKAPDYVTDVPGSVEEGRCLAPTPFDGACLGRHFGLVLPPRPAFMVMGGLMVGRREIPMLLRPFASWTALRHVTRLLVRYAWDRLRYPRGTRLLMGNALIARALHSALERDVNIRPSTALVRLIVEAGRVTGAVAQTAGGDLHIHARCGVVLATGGFPQAGALRKQLAPHHPHCYSLASPGNTGDAVRTATAIGAALDTEVRSPGFWTPASVARDAHGRETVFPYGHLDRGKPGAIIVDRSGRRFVNESDSYHHVVLGMFRVGATSPGKSAFIVCDRRFIDRYGLGLVRPAPFPKGPHLRNGYLKRASTLAGLAVALGVDPAGLDDEVRKHNRYAAQGQDPEFHKGDTAFNRYNGDDRGQANACLLPIDQPPYFAIEIHPCSLGTAAGLMTDGDARVLDTAGRPIEGLYACGNDMGSVMRGAYPGPGITIGPAIVFAWRAMRHAAAHAAQAVTRSPA